jgi:polysaccharide deacetylase family sporulation protein PdaB
MLRENRIKKRKQRLYLILVIATVLLTLILHRQIIRGVFSPMVKGVFYRVQTEDKAVSITFDVVWGPGEIERILDTLDRYHVSATFFLTGEWLRENPDVAREIILRGHEIGHHGYSHKHFTELEDEKLAEEFARMEEALQEELNMTVELFRPPYGEIDQRVYDFVSERGYTTVLWSIDPHDWVDPGVDKIVSRVVKNIHNGAIILLHANATQSADALPIIIQCLKMQEYELLPFTQLREKGEE